MPGDSMTSERPFRSGDTDRAGDTERSGGTELARGMRHAVGKDRPADDARLAGYGRAPDERKAARADGSARTDDLTRRLQLLPPGHPSSPYEADGSRRPPVPRLCDLELPDTVPADRIRPLTDEEHAEHVADVRARLEKARADGLATDEQYTIDPVREIWSADRDAQHDLLIGDLYEQAVDVPNERRAVIAGGLAGAGKSTVLAEHANIDRSQYLTLNPDDVKEEMAKRGMIPQVEGLSPMEASDLAHEESSYVTKRLARKAEADGKNVLWDITMSSRASTEWRVETLRSAGYNRISGIFVDIPIETSVRRAEGRHRADHDKYRADYGLGGRHIGPETIRAQNDPDWDSANRKTFEVVKHRFDAWSRYDNSVDGRFPVLVETSAPQVHDAQPEEAL